MQTRELIDQHFNNTKLDGSLNLKSDSTTQAQVSIASIPEVRVKIDSGTDLVALLGFVITAIIVVATTYFTIRNFKTSTDSQERIASHRDNTELQKAKLEALSKNRQEWINTLRNSVSEYISAATTMWDLHQLRVGLDPHQANLSEEQVVRNGREWSYKYHLAKTDAIRLKAKIALLSNPKEDDFHDLLGLINELYESAQDGGASLSHTVSNIVILTQKILKSEWTRVKNFE